MKSFYPLDLIYNMAKSKTCDLVKSDILRHNVKKGYEGIKIKEENHKLKKTKRKDRFWQLALDIFKILVGILIG